MELRDQSRAGWSGARGGTSRIGGGAEIGWIQGVGLCAALLSSACVHQLPPPESPAREISTELERRAHADEATAGQGTIVLDIVDGPGSVEDLGAEADGAHAVEICATTPCVARLELGDHRLVFHHEGRDDEVSLTVSETPRAHRRVMSYDTGEHREYIGIAIAGFTVGGMFMSIMGPVSTIDGDNLRDHDAGLILGAAFGIGALAVGIVGVILALVDAQEVRDGLSLEWDL